MDANVDTDTTPGYDIYTPDYLTPGAKAALNKLTSETNPDDLIEDIGELVGAPDDPASDERLQTLARLLGAIGQTSPEADAVCSMIAGMAGML